MLHIVLLILKIIGIVLGVLAGLLLLAVGLVLFVPVHYQIEAMRSEEEGNPPIEAKAKVTWLFPLIDIKYLYPAEVYLKVRVLLFTVFRLPPKEKKPKKKKRDTRKKNGKKAGQNHTMSGREKSNHIKTDTDMGGQAKENIVKEEKISKAEHTNYDDKDSEEDLQNNQQKLSIKEKIIKIWRFCQNIWYTLKGICGKIKEILENMEYYLDVLKSDTFMQAYSLCKDELISVLSYIRPRKFKADLIIGMDDPAATGQILSYYGILYPIVGNYVTVVGDFDKKRIEGSVFLKGRIKIFTLIKAVIRIYYSKDIKKLLKLFKKEGV